MELKKGTMYVARYSLENFQHKCQHYPIDCIKTTHSAHIVLATQNWVKFWSEKKPTQAQQKTHKSNISRCCPGLAKHFFSLVSVLPKYCHHKEAGRHARKKPHIWFSYFGAAMFVNTRARPRKIIITTPPPSSSCCSTIAVPIIRVIGALSRART